MSHNATTPTENAAPNTTGTYPGAAPVDCSSVWGPARDCCRNSRPFDYGSLIEDH
jgi:hypothetical protein